jgi:pimeloyl-ACP methyl ester carboxylesterase
MPEQIDVTANGLRFRALSDGPADGPLALCLHGFPDSAWTWRHLLPELASAGFRAVAPWLRGYAPTEVPSRPSYGVGALVADVEALHDALGGDARAVLIGHDWGAIAAYPAASFAPERWSRVVTMAVPPPAAMGDTFLRYEQLKRSFYVFLFQTPIAELAVGADDLAFIDGLWRDWSPGYDASGDLPLVKDALRAPANLSAAIGYYRATLGAAPPDPAYAAETAAPTTPPQPTLYLHGENDGCLGVDSARGALGALSPGSRAEILAGVGHFLHVERPDVVNRLVVEWLGGT